MSEMTLNNSGAVAVRYVVRALTSSGPTFASHEPYSSTPHLGEARVYESKLRAEVAARIMSTVSALHMDDPLEFEAHAVSVVDT